MGVKSYDGSLIYDTEIDTSGFDKGSKQIKDKADDTGDSVKKKAKETTSDVKKSCQDTKDTLDSLNKTAKAVLLTAASVGAGILAMGISYNSQMENYKTSFEVMTGSAEKAADAVERLKKMGAATPFELPQLAETTQLLMNYGFTVDDAIDHMSMLGDISQGNADKLGRIAMAYGQMSSAGKVALEDVKQMIEAGFNPLQEISQTTGESMASLYDRISKGTISVDEITASMQRATSEGGKYFQSMEKQSQTLQGQWSTLKDNVSALTGQMAEDISEKLTTTVLPDLIDMVDKFSQMWEDGTLQDRIGDVVTALAAFGSAVVAVNLVLFANDIRETVKHTKDFTAATKAGAAAQKLMNAELMKNPYVLVAAALATLVVGMSTYAATHKSAASEISESYQNTIASIDKSLAREVAQAEMTSMSINDLKDELYDLESQIKSGTLSEEEAVKVRANFVEKAAQLEEILPGITQYLFDETNEINIQYEAVEKLAGSYSKLMVAKATANAMQSKLEAAIAAREEAKHTMDITPSDTTEGYYAPFWKYNPTTLALMGFDFHTQIITNPEWAAAKEAYDMALVNEEYFKKRAEETQKEYETLYKELFPNGFGETDDNSRNGRTTIVDTLKTEGQDALRTLKHYLAMGKISEVEYYQELKKYRDEYLTEGSSEWQQYTEEIDSFNEKSVENYVDLLADAQDEANKMLDELEDKRQSIADGLKSNKSPVEYGTINGEKFVNLANYDQENNKLMTYNRMLDELFAKRPDLPGSVLKQLQGMDIDQGMKYVEALLRATDFQYESMLKNARLEDENAKLVSSKLMTDELEEAKQILENKFGQLPEDFFDIGADSMEFFGKGFLGGLDALLQLVRDQISAEMSVLSAGAIAFNSAGGDSSSVVNNYNNSYNIGSNKETTTEQLTAITNWETMNRMRGIK